MLTVCWSAKGGSGVTVVACALALMTAIDHESSWLIDLAGDAPAALGIAERSSPGAHDWVSSASAPVASLEALGVAANGRLRVMPRGTSLAALDHPRWSELARFLADGSSHAVIDAGSDPASIPPALISGAQRNLLVIRPCYLALRRAATAQLKPTGVIVIHEPGRALGAHDIGHAVGAPVVAEISLDPAVARAVDAGLLVTRLPRSLGGALRELVR